VRKQEDNALTFLRPIKRLYTSKSNHAKVLIALYTTKDRGFNKSANCTGEYADQTAPGNGFDNKPAPTKDRTYLIPILKHYLLSASAQILP